jgi:adenylate cyclase class 2
MNRAAKAGEGRREIEIKLRAEDIAPNLAGVKRKLTGLRFRLAKARTHEINWLFDDAAGTLRRTRRLLRLRKSGKEWLLTVKGVAEIGGRHKERDEAETPVEDGEGCRRALEMLGYSVTFIYERYRTTYIGRGLEVVIDETPAGIFLELEGPPEAIDGAAQRLDVDGSKYITLSYFDVFAQVRRERGIDARNFTFEEFGK